MNVQLNQAGILLGSNIEPEKNLIEALKLLGRGLGSLRFSSAWETESVGFDGPNYLNAAVVVETDLDAQALRSTVLQPLEERLGRQRFKDKFAPRTIDLDIVAWNRNPVSEDLWKYAHAALPTAQVIPDLRLPDSNETLSDIALRLAQGVWARERADVLDSSAARV